MKDYSWTQYRRDAGLGLRMAVAFSAYTAVLPFGILGLVNLWETLARKTLETPWAIYGAVVAVVWSSYLIAGQLGAGAYFLLRPVRRRRVRRALGSTTHPCRNEPMITSRSMGARADGISLWARQPRTRF